MNAIKIIHPEVNNGCKSIKEKKCFYCSACNNQIGTAHSAQFNVFLSVGLILGVYFTVNSIGTYFDLPEYIHLPMYVLFFYLALVIFINFYPFSCQEEDEPEIKREKFDEFYSPHENVRIDNFERKTINTVISIPIIFLVITFIVLGFLVLKGG
jgi:hypothetical protein